MQRNPRMTFDLKRLGLLVISAMLLPAGCADPINPFRDDLPTAASITTTSARLVRQQQAESDIRHRGWAETIVQSQDQGVSHWPLWWSDTLEDRGSDDGQFAWTYLDYLCIVYAPARQTVNAAALPVSVILDPPGAVRCSDGRISPQTFGLVSHDPIFCSGVAIPPDIIEAYESPLTE